MTDKNKSQSARRLSAGAVVVRETADAPLVLLLRAYRYWDFPKGLVEPDETPLTAARREVEEETGLTELDFAWGAVHYDTLPYSRGKIARYFLARTSQAQVELRPNPETTRREHHEYRWVRFSEAGGLLSLRVRRVLHWAIQTMG